MWKKAEDEGRCLLVLDHYKPHYAADTQSLLTSLDTDYVYTPAGCTGVAQLMDVSFNATFKRKILD